MGVSFSFFNSVRQSILFLYMSICDILITLYHRVQISLVQIILTICFLFVVEKILG